MTKEEILKAEYSKLISNPEKVYAQNPSIIRAAHTSMDEYAKREAIGFAEYLGMWGWELCPAGHSESGKWISPTNIQYGFRTIEELYTLYLNQIL